MSNPSPRPEAPLRVLYVDDDRINGFLFSQSCQPDPSIEVQLAGSGEEALAAVAQWTPDVLVVDLHLPDTDGYALLAPLRLACARPPALAILCSAEDPADLTERASESGYAGVWAKPVDLAVLRREIAIIRGRP